jgi:Tol biopolymer transport system component
MHSLFKQLSASAKTARVILFGGLLTGCSMNSGKIADTEINYPGPLPDSTALVFLPGIVSKDSLDFNAAFSPDGKTFYFSRSQNRKYIILESIFDGQKWTAPVPSPLFDTAYSNTDPFFDTEGSLYFISSRPTSKTDSIDDYDIYRIRKQGARWSEPIRLDAVNSDSTEYYVSVAANGNIYFASYRDGNLDLFISEKKGMDYYPPQHLGPLINSSSDEHDPLIAADESYLVFTSGRPGGYGEADLYISFRNNGQWGQPRNMGPKINGPTYEYCPNLSPDGRYFFFSSESDVKWISSTILQQQNIR